MANVNFNANGKTALVSGANRGIGKAIVKELIQKGASKVYAGARNIDSLNELKAEYGDKVIPVELDVTKQETMDRLGDQLDQLDILVNNAGVFAPGSLLSADAVSSLQQNLDVNVWGPLRLTNSVRSYLAKETPAAIVNISSLAGLGNMPFGPTYSVSKAAVHSMTQGMRAEMAPNNTLVMGVYPGVIDTDMAESFEIEKDSPENVAKNIVEGIENGVEDVFPDAMSAQIGPLYATNPKAVEQSFAAMAENQPE